MNLIDVYQGMSSNAQLLHGLHFMLCSFAVLIACGALRTKKGSAEHKFFGLIYLPLSLAALLFATVLAWNESSLLLFCFNTFCAYLLMSGWRAVHEAKEPTLIDWLLPGFLLASAILALVQSIFYSHEKQGLYLTFFALNALYLCARDWLHLRNRIKTLRGRVFFADMYYGVLPKNGWLNRHVAGMIGSMLANTSVVVLTILPFAWHWLWSATIIAAAAMIAWHQRQKKQRLKETLATILKPDFGVRKMPPRRRDGTSRRAA
jgi:hypothetical protein